MEVEEMSSGTKATGRPCLRSGSQFYGLLQILVQPSSTTYCRSESGDAASYVTLPIKVEPIDCPFSSEG